MLWEAAQQTLEPHRARLNTALGTAWEEWQMPRDADAAWSAEAARDHAAWWEARIERQRKIDASIARRADIEFLYDRPYQDTSRVRVAGPFTVESLSPHRVVPADEDELLDLPAAPAPPPLAFHLLRRRNLGQRRPLRVIQPKPLRHDPALPAGSASERPCAPQRGQTLEHFPSLLARK